MSKIPIAEQIEAYAELLGAAPKYVQDDVGPDRYLAIAKTLEFVRDHEPEIRYAIARKKALAEAKADTVVNRILDEFPGAEIEGVGEAD